MIAPKRRGASAVIFLIVFLDLLGVGLIAPLSPYIVERFSSTGTAVAILTLSYSAAQFLAAPVLGVLSDRFGRRPVLFFSVLGSALGYVIFATANSMQVLFLSRLLDGASGGNISTAQAYIADITPAKDRAKSYGLVGAAFGLGFTLGPTFGALLSHISLMAPVWAAAGVSLTTAGLVFFFLPETRSAQERSTLPIRVVELNPFRALIAVMRIPVLATLITAVFLFGFAHAELRTSFAILLRDKLKFEASQTEWMFAYMGLLAILVQGGLVRRIVPRLGDRRTAMIGLPLAMIGYALMPVGSTWYTVGAALTILAIGGGLANPTITSMLSGNASAREQGMALGASQSAASLGLIVGPIAAGQLYDHAGWSWPFWTGAVMVGGAFLIIAMRPPRTPTVASPDAPPAPDVPAA